MVATDVIDRAESQVRVICVDFGMSVFPGSRPMREYFECAASCQLLPPALQQTALLFDNLVGAGEERLRDRKAERLRNFGI